MSTTEETVDISGNTYKVGDAIRLGLVPAPTGPENPNATPTEKWTNQDIDTWAADHNLDLGAASTKADKLAVIASFTPGPDETH